MLPMGSDSGFSSSQVVVFVPTLTCGMLCVFLSSPYKHAKVRVIGKSAINSCIYKGRVSEVCLSKREAQVD